MPTSYICRQYDTSSLTIHQFNLLIYSFKGGRSRIKSAKVGWLVLFYVPSTARSFRDGTPFTVPCEGREARFLKQEKYSEQIKIQQ